jgi:hypothetical protein
MIKVLSNSEKKLWILQNWKRFNGKTLTVVLNKYYASLKEPEPLYVTAARIFETDKSAL